MCVTYPGRIVAVNGSSAGVSIRNRVQSASLVLVPDAAPGDWVLVAAGAVLEILSADDADELIALIEADEAAQRDVDLPARVAIPHRSVQESRA